MNELLLRGGRVLDPSTGTDTVADVRIRDGHIVEVGADLEVGTATVLDCAGLWVTPGFVDLHTHLREPGGEDAEDIASGSAAAAAGGFTAVCPMANTDPVCDSPAVVQLVRQRAAEVGLVDVFPVAAVTRGLAGEVLTDMADLVAAGVDAFSDDGRPVADSLVMRRALQYASDLGAVIIDHAEDLALTADAQMNEGPTSGRLGLAGWPHEAEEIVVARDLILAAGLGARLHIAHVSTAAAAEMIRLAKRRGVPVTAEVTPHHLTLDDSAVTSFDPNLKVNPPLRSAADVAALRQALADGTIDAVATDHAPHPPEAKEREWTEAPCGMLGLETAFAVIYTELVCAGLLDPLTAVARLTIGPASVRDVGGHGRGIRPGLPAHLTVIDPEARWTVEGRRLHSRARNTPFEGRKLTGRPVHTILHGRFTLRDGEVQW